MNIILAQSLTYVPALTGASKGNRMLMEELARRGHSCTIVGMATAGSSPQALAAYRAGLDRQGIAVSQTEAGVDTFTVRGVTVRAAATPGLLRAALRRQIETSPPTWVIVSSEDMDQALLRTALEVCPNRVIFIARTTPMLPFGPASFDPSPQGAQLFEQLAGIMTVSEHMRSYIHEWSGLESMVMKLPVYGPGPFPQFGSFDRGYLTLINPCAYKGIAIFLALARRFPDLPFAAIPTWGTTGADLVALRALPNMHVLEPVENIYDIFRQTRALLMPSLWDEAYGRTSVEAMLSGVPVLASAVGGLPEAKLGVDYVLPVRPIERYQKQFDERLSPVPVIPEQDITPWAAAIEELLGDREHYRRISDSSREAAHAHVAGLSFDCLEQYLLTLAPAQRSAPARDAAPTQASPADLEHLTRQQRALLALRLRKKNSAAPRQTIPRRDRSVPLRLSFAQQRLWFLDQLVTENAFYNMPTAVRLRGALDLGALQRSLQALTLRHETLRTTFPNVDGEPGLAIAPTVDLPLRVVELGAASDDRREHELRRLLDEEAARPFDLVAGPLIRATLFRLGPDDCALLLVLHHIISDGWSHRILVHELMLLYNAYASGRSASLPELPIQYADFAVWQRAWLQGQRLEEQLGYWRARLADLPLFQLPADYPRPTVQTFRTARQQFLINGALLARLGEIGRQEGTTLFMTMLAAFQVLLARYAGQPDVVVGTPIANRTRTELEGLIGCFVNMLVIRSCMAPTQTFRAALRGVRDGAKDAYAHQDLPFEQLVEELRPARDLGRHPLFQILFQLHQGSAEQQASGGVVLERLALDAGHSNFDLTLVLVEYPDQILGRFEYATELFRTETVERMAEHFLVLLQALADHPDEQIGLLPLLTPQERRLLTEEWQSRPLPLHPTVCIQHLFEAQARLHPERPALLASGQELSYGELNARAERLARHLRALGVRSGTLVGVCMERTLHLPVALLGILKAGGAYLPLDPDYPAERLLLMLEEAQAPLILTQLSLRERLAGQAARLICLDAGWAPIAEDDTPLADPAHAEQLAYVIYTSGSTGRPKGVAIPHRSAVELLHWARGVFSDAELSGVLASTSICFDLSVFELFAPLSWGGRVILVESILHLPELVGSVVSLINTVPSAVAELLRLDAIPESVQTVNLAGEALPKQIVAQLYQRPSIRRVFNLYGPSEDTTYSTAALLPRGVDEPPPIGRPIEGTQAYILDPQLQLVPVGLPGELYLGGAGLAHGYLKRPDLTAERFVPNPFGTEGWALGAGEVSVSPSPRLYKTGDLVRYRPDGQIEYLGRLDHQVKIRGFRIELDEIAARLCQHPDVGQAVALAREDAGDRRLVAYVLPSEAARARGLPEPLAWSDALRAWLQTALPHYMIPASVVCLDAFPLTSNGKLDRAALPVPGQAARPQPQRPLTPVEEIIAGIWAAVLRLDHVDPEAEFFALGGHSLLATQVVARMRVAFQVPLPLQAIFEAPTVAGLARLVASSQHAPAPETLPPLLPAPRGAPLPASFAQERLWQLQRDDPATTRYNIPIVLRLRGQLDLPVLEYSLRALALRHEALRTTFAEVGGRLLQQIAAEPASALVLRDLRHLPAPEREPAAQQVVRAELLRPFDLGSEPLLRAILVQIAEQDAALILTMHHIVSDGWSLGILGRDLSALYAAACAGVPADLPPLPVQFADFAVWQRQWLQGQALDRLAGYWRQQLASAPPQLNLPTDFARPASQTYRGSLAPTRLSPALTAQLEALGQRQGATLFMVLLAGFYLLLHSYSHETDLVVGTSIANRRLPEVEQVVGLFFNLLPLRARLDPQMPFDELLRQVRAVALGAYAHQDLPFKLLREHLEQPENPNYAPFLQAQLVLQNLPLADLEMPGIAVEPQVFDPGTAKSDLILSLRPEAGGLRGGLEYNSDLFRPATAAAMLERFQTLLQRASAAPDHPLAALCADLDPPTG